MPNGLRIPSASRCVTLGWPERVRLTLLDGCGRPIYGPSSTFVLSSPPSVEITQNITEGEVFELIAGNGEPCYSVPQPDRVSGDGWQFDLCGIDTEMWASLNDTYIPMIGYRGDTVGLSEGYSLSSARSAFVEVWVSQPMPDLGDCPEDVEVEEMYTWIGAGRLRNWRSGDTITLSNEANPATLHAVSAAGARWGRGPYDVMLDENGQPAPLPEPYEPDRRKSWVVVDLPPPPAACGAQPLSNPAGPLFIVECLDDGTDGRSVHVRLVGQIDEDANYQIDWGDGTSGVITDGEAEHTYSAAFVDEYEGTYIGVWQTDAQRLYRAELITLPCEQPTISVEPTSGDAPLQVVATVEGCETPVMTWDNTTPVDDDNGNGNGDNGDNGNGGEE